MSEQHEPEKTKEPTLPEPLKPKEAAAEPLPLTESVVSTAALKGEEVKEPSLVQQPSAAQELKHEEDKTSLSVANHEREQEWIAGEQLELLRIPPPTIWPATLALGITGIAFGVVTHWILSVAGLFLFLLGAAGWIEDLRKDVLQ